jgi:hypothetical protein
MSYNLTLSCGCVVYVSQHPKTGVAHTRVVQSRSATCRHRRHEIGARLFLWEILPETPDAVKIEWSDQEDVAWSA